MINISFEKCIFYDVYFKKGFFQGYHTREFESLLSL